MSQNLTWFHASNIFCVFNVESICGSTSNFVATCSANSHPFEFSSRIKHLTLGILKLLFTALSNHNNKVAFIQVDEDFLLERSSEFMRTFHNMNIIVKTEGVDASSLDG